MATSQLWTYRLASFRVVDGDTIDAMIDVGFETFRRVNLRLARIDAPELRTPEGPLASANLIKLLGNDVKRVTVQTKRVATDQTDKYHRYIAEVLVDDVNLNDKMVADGFAVYATY